MLIQKNQNFFHLSCIQSVSLGLSAIIIGKQLAFLYGAGTAICSIIIGNLILWLVALAIVSIFEEGMNAIKSVEEYIGKHTSILFATILNLAFLGWYAFQLDQTLIGLETLFQYSYPWKNNRVIQIGATLGLIISMLSIGGIQLLKWITVISLPFVFVYNIYVISISEYSLFSEENWGVSFHGVITTVLLLLPGVINLPTVFRYSISKADSLLALTFMLVWITFFECASIWMGFSPESVFVLQNLASSHFIAYVIPTAMFVLISLISTNLLNINFASACYETFIPFFEGKKVYAIFGMLGTAVYTFIQITGPIGFFIKLLDDYISILGFVLIVGILSRFIVRHRPRRFEKVINASSWLIGCMAGTIFQIFPPSGNIHPFLYGIGVSALFFLIVFLIEETIWAIQKLTSCTEIERGL